MGYRNHNGRWTTGKRDAARHERLEAAKAAFRNAGRDDRPIESATSTGRSKRRHHDPKRDADKVPTADRKRELELLDELSPGSTSSRQLAHLHPGSKGSRQHDHETTDRDTRKAARQLLELARHGVDPKDVSTVAALEQQAVSPRRKLTGRETTNLNRATVEELANAFDDNVEALRTQDAEDDHEDFDLWLEETYGLTPEEFDAALDELDPQEQEAVLDVLEGLYDEASQGPHDTHDPGDLDWDDASDPDDDSPDWDTRATAARAQVDAD